ncbi:MAG: Nif11-like leader peptide family natural product precursor [Betaproteobacteria bacterium]
MSEASAKKFVEKLEHDKALIAEVKAAKGNLEAVAKKHDFDFTSAELKAVVKQRFGGSKSPHFDDPNLTCFA